MSDILVTGASGFLGGAFIPHLLSQGHTVYGLSRHPPPGSKSLIPLRGNVTEENLGLSYAPSGLNAIYHIAGVLRLGEDRDGSIWETNVTGTKRVIDFCTAHDVEHLYFISTAYTQGRNVYERSKALCEMMVKESKIPKVTIFKPSIVVGTEDHTFHGHVVQYALLVIKVHRRAEIVRRQLEGTILRLSTKPVLRVAGNPQRDLNLIQVDQVAMAMAKIKETGTFWLTHPSPPSVKEVLDGIGEFVRIRISVEPEEFLPMPFESIFNRMSKAFAPYLLGDSFTSDLKDCPPITKDFIRDTIEKTLPRG